MRGVVVNHPCLEISDHFIENGGTANLGTAGDVHDCFTGTLTGWTDVTNARLPVGQKMINAAAASDSFGEPIAKGRWELFQYSRKNLPVDELELLLSENFTATGTKAEDLRGNSP
jgi:hypothetical protein